MTAKEAKNISIESKNIMDRINEAAFNGENIITVFSLTDQVKEGLTKLGYNVKCISQGFYENAYEISW